eukprot:6469187-Amphidinium_carterae.4
MTWVGKGSGRSRNGLYLEDVAFRHEATEPPEIDEPEEVTNTSSYKEVEEEQQFKSVYTTRTSSLHFILVLLEKQNSVEEWIALFLWVGGFEVEERSSCMGSSPSSVRCNASRTDLDCIRVAADDISKGYTSMQLAETSTEVMVKASCTCVDGVTSLKHVANDVACRQARASCLLNGMLLQSASCFKRTVLIGMCGLRLRKRVLAGQGRRSNTLCHLAKLQMLASEQLKVIIVACLVKQKPRQDMQTRKERASMPEGAKVGKTPMKKPAK